MENMILAFTIILSFIGISISLGSLVFAIIFLVRLTKLEKAYSNINQIKEILIYQAVFYIDNKMIQGKEALNLIMKQYDCDEFMALKILYQKNKD